MTYHTIEMQTRLHYNEYLEIINNFKEYCIKNNKKIYETYNANNNNYESHRCTLCYALYEELAMVIKFISYKSNRKSCNTVYYGVRIIINPRRALYKDYIGLSNKESTEEFTKIFDYKTKSISDIFPSFEEFRVSRIDYCINCYFETEEHTKEVFELLRRSYKIPNGYDKYVEKNIISKRVEAPKDSIYLFNKSVRINIYLKYNQMKKEKIALENLDESKKLIRFEIQIKGAKKYGIKKKYLLKNMTVMSFMNEEIFNNIFNYYIKQIFPKGSYYRYSNAREKILAYKKEKYRDYMLCFLELVSKKRSIEKAKKEFLKLNFNDLALEEKEKILDKTIKLFDKIKVNPLTIPEKWVNDIVPSVSKIIKSN